MTVTVNGESYEPGCYGEGSRGQYLPDHVIELANAYVGASTDVVTDRDAPDFDHEALIWASDEACEKLNDATDDGYWEFHEGEFFLRAQYETNWETLSDDDTRRLDSIGPVVAYVVGGGLAQPDDDDCLQPFDTLADALSEFESCWRGHGFTGKGRPYQGHTPAMSDSLSAFVYVIDPSAGHPPSVQDTADFLIRGMDRDGYGDVETDVDGDPVWEVTSI